MTHSIPFENLGAHEVAYAVVHSAARPGIPPDNTIPPHILSIITSAWSENPDDRPDFSQILDQLQGVGGDKDDARDSDGVTSNHSSWLSYDSLRMEGGHVHQGASLNGSIQNLGIDLPPGQVPLHEYIGKSHIGAGGVIVSSSHGSAETHKSRNYGSIEDFGNRKSEKNEYQHVGVNLASYEPKRRLSTSSDGTEMSKSGSLVKSGDLGGGESKEEVKESDGKGATLKKDKNKVHPA